MLRNAVRSLSTNTRLEHLVRNSIAGDEVVERFVAGEYAANAVVTAMDYVSKGLDVTFAQTITTAADQDAAHRATDVYLETINLASGAGIGAFDVSVSLPGIGLELGTDGQALATENLTRVVEAASHADATVTVDMGRPRLVDAVLAAVRELRVDHPSVGVTLQAHLRRTRADLVELLTAGSRVRLCKGAFPAREDETFPTTHQVETNFVRLLRLLMESPATPLVATHDHRMISISHELVRRSGRGRGDYEFQMLMGTRPLEHRRLVDTGRRLRVYLPFGRDWYPYLVHRLADNPRLLGMVGRQLLNRR